MATKQNGKQSDLQGWIARSDRGPHNATLPSGQKITFRIPDSNELIRAERLPDRLVEIALMAAAYTNGADGYMSDLAVQALQDDAHMPKLKKAVQEGLELRDWLVAQMLVEPELQPEDVSNLPAEDVKMLLQFAERHRDTDAEGVKLPIVILEEFARFRDLGLGEPDDGDGGRVAAAVSESDNRSDGETV